MRREPMRTVIVRGDGQRVRNPRWRRWQAESIRRRFKAGRTLRQLFREHGRHVVTAAIREGLCREVRP